MGHRHCWILSTSLALSACAGNLATPNDDAGVDGGTDLICEPARTYVGFGARALEADRAALAVGADRLRIKPFAALSAEYGRALGLAGFDTSAFAATFAHEQRLFSAWIPETSGDRRGRLRRVAVIRCEPDGARTRRPG